MTLIETVRALDSFDEESTIYALEPWTEDSAVIVAPELGASGLAIEAQHPGFKYFLEVFIARQFLEGWVQDFDGEPTPQEKCVRLIQYAINDA